MKKSVLILLAAILPLWSTAIARGGTLYNDGGIHDIDWAYGDVISVENSFWYEPTTVNLITNGIISQLYAHEDSQINIFDGKINSYLTCRDYSRISVTGGEIMTELAIYDNSTVDISGGTIQRIGTIPGYQGNASITGGTIDVLSAQGGMLTFSGGFVEYVQAVGEGEFIMTGGDLDGNLIATNNSRVDISGGNITGMLDIRLDSIVTITGRDFILDGHEVSGEVINPLAETNYGHLTGNYLNGLPFDIDLAMAPDTGIILTTPEPCTALILALGSIIIIHKRKIRYSPASF